MSFFKPSNHIISKDEIRQHEENKNSTDMTWNTLKSWIRADGHTRYLVLGALSPAPDSYSLYPVGDLTRSLDTVENTLEAHEINVIDVKLSALNEPREYSMNVKTAGYRMGSIGKLRGAYSNHGIDKRTESGYDNVDIFYVLIKYRGSAK